MAAEIGIVLAQGGIEVVKLLLVWFMQAARQAGMTPEETEKLYFEEKQKFLARKPGDLPDV